MNMSANVVSSWWSSSTLLCWCTISVPSVQCQCSIFTYFRCESVPHQCIAILNFDTWWLRFLSRDSRNRVVFRRREERKW
jgi:hypothetical protein